MNSIAYFEIQSSEPEQGVRFYHEVFGWEFTRVPDLPVEYWSIKTDGMRGGLLKRPAPIPPPESGTNAYVCSVEVRDFDAIEAIILKCGGIVALPKFAIPGVCYQGYFVDPDGNTFGIFQPDPNAK